MTRSDRQRRQPRPPARPPETPGPWSSPPPNRGDDLVASIALWALIAMVVLFIAYAANA